MRSRGSIAVVVCLLVVTISWACSVPVFRYALERWRLSPYEVLVYHRGPLSEEQKKELTQLEVYLLHCNIDITTIDLNKRPEPALKQFWEAHVNEEKLPQVFVRYPNSREKTPLLFQGSMRELLKGEVLDSKARQDILSHLMTGETAVVLILEGKKGHDPNLREMIQQQIIRLQKEIRLPEATPDGPQIESTIPLKVSFLLREMSRDNRDEKSLIEMLLRSEDLHSVEGPIVFLIFGRGRVLCGLHGEQLTADEFEHALRFLCGKCGCQVKELNPGMDLLMKANWERSLNPQVFPVAPMTTEEKTSSPKKTSPTTETTAPEKSAPEAKQDRHTGLIIALAIAVGLMLLSGIWLLRRVNSDR